MDSISSEYDPDYDAPHQARALVRDFLNREGADDLVFLGELLLTELVANVVRHAHSRLNVTLTWDLDTLRAEVRDGSSILPAVADLADEDGGYGLRIIDVLAQNWGVTQLEEGKAVWFTLRRESAERR
jgi:anti-sigma regulatory factor (Ser/Thr protein kinase)